MSTPLLPLFDRIAVISLPDRTDRRDAVARELRRIGQPIDGERVRLVDGIRPADAGDFPSVGARGCFLSHLQVLRDAQRDGVRRLLVLEDDVMFARALRHAGALEAGLARDDWHLAYPGHALGAQAGALRWRRTREPIECAHCYAVHADALPVLVEHLEACLLRPIGHPLGSPMHVDGALTVLRRHRPDLVTLRASRSLAGQRSSRSDIIGPSWLDRLPLAAAASSARALRNTWRRVVGAA